jgi:gluconolactonase
MRIEMRLWAVAACLIVGVISPSARAGEAIFAEGASPQLLQEKGAGESPAWHPELGLLMCGNGHIYRRDRTGQLSIYRENAGGANGLLFDQEGRLVICESAQRRVTRLEKDGKLTILADRYNGRKFNQPNDLTIDFRGRIYFSDPQYGDRSKMEQKDIAGRRLESIYRIEAPQSVDRATRHEVDRPNGLVITPDGRYLYVAENTNNVVGGPRKLWRFTLTEDGHIDGEFKMLIYDWKTSRGPDGMKLDAAGRLFVAAGLNQPKPPYETQAQPTAGIYVFSPQGKLLEFLPIPRDEVTNCCFGDDDLKTLYITAGGSLWSIRVNTPGKPVWPRLEEAQAAAAAR